MSAKVLSLKIAKQSRGLGSGRTRRDRNPPRLPRSSASWRNHRGRNRVGAAERDNLLRDKRSAWRQASSRRGMQLSETRHHHRDGQLTPWAAPGKVKWRRRASVSAARLEYDACALKIQSAPVLARRLLSTRTSGRSNRLDTRAGGTRSRCPRRWEREAHDPAIFLALRRFADVELDAAFSRFVENDGDILWLGD